MLEYTDFDAIHNKYDISLETLTGLVASGCVDAIKYYGIVLYSLLDIEEHLKVKKAVWYLRVPEGEEYEEKINSLIEQTQSTLNIVLVDRGDSVVQATQLLSMIEMGEVSRVVLENIDSLELVGSPTFLTLCGEHSVSVIIDNA